MWLLLKRACQPQPSSGSVNLFLLSLFMVMPSLVAGAGAILADLCQALLVIASCQGAINGQKSTGEASHAKIAPFPAAGGSWHAWSGVMLCYVYKSKQCALLMSVISIMVCSVRALGNTAASCKLGCLDMLWQTWSDLCRDIMVLTASWWWQQHEGPFFLVFLGEFWAVPVATTKYIR